MDDIPKDPIEVRILFQQLRANILTEKYLVTEIIAYQLAGIESQVHLNYFLALKQNPSGLRLDLKNLLPKIYVQVKDIERKILNEYKKHSGLTESEATILYIKTVRELQTYGAHFFLVKRKKNNLNKLIPEILGVKKDSIMSLDYNTKRILNVWPLTIIRRWSVSPNTLTLDFGEYSNDYYAAQTTETKEIVQYISTYIEQTMQNRNIKKIEQIPNNPVELRLLFHEIRENIIIESHPVTEKIACQLAGIECQINLNYFTALKQNSSGIRLHLPNLLPKVFLSVKDIENNILIEYKNHAELSEIDATILYIKIVCQLPTYGAQFFLVQRKQIGDRTLLPQLLGIKQDSLVILDNTTKDILNIWPLTIIRKWRISSNIFTLDFGEYSGEYYAVETPEASKIVHCISKNVGLRLNK